MKRKEVPRSPLILYSVAMLLLFLHLPFIMFCAGVGIIKAVSKIYKEK